MDPQPPKDAVLVCKSGDSLRIPRSLLAESSSYLRNVLEKVASPVLVMPDVTLAELVDLIEFLKGNGPTHLEQGRLLEIAQRYSIRTSAPKSTPYLPFKKRRLELTPPSSPELQDVNLNRQSPLRVPPVVAPVLASPCETSSSPPPADSPASTSESPRVSTPPAQNPMGVFPLLPFLLQSTLLANSGMLQTAPTFPHIMSSPQTHLQPTVLVQTPAQPQPPPMLATQTSSVTPHLSPRDQAPSKPIPILPRPFPPQGQTAMTASQSTASLAYRGTPSQDLVPCQDCGKSFTVSNLPNHRRRNHRHLQEPVLCCGERFSTRWHLSLHRRSINHRRTHWTPAVSAAHADDERPLSPTYSD